MSLIVSVNDEWLIDTGSPSAREETGKTGGSNECLSCQFLSRLRLSDLRIELSRWYI